MENPSYLEWNFPFFSKKCRVFQIFLGSTLRLLAEHLWSPEQWLGTTNIFGDRTRFTFSNQSFFLLQFSICQSFASLECQYSTGKICRSNMTNNDIVENMFSFCWIYEVVRLCYTTNLEHGEKSNKNLFPASFLFVDYLFARIINCLPHIFHEIYLLHIVEWRFYSCISLVKILYFSSQPASKPPEKNNRRGHLFDLFSYCTIAHLLSKYLNYIL